MILFCIFVEFALRETENLPQHGIIRPGIPSVVSSHLAPLREKEQRVTHCKSQSKGLAEAGRRPGTCGFCLGSPAASRDIPTLAMHRHPHQT